MMMMKNHIKVEVIEKNDNAKKITKKVKSAVFISDEDEITEIEVDKINASENVYIIKSQEKGKKDKIIKTKSEFSFNPDERQPLFILDDKEITAEEMKNIDVNSIQSLSVFKDESAIKKYGEKGKNGVIVIKLKK